MLLQAESPLEAQSPLPVAQTSRLIMAGSSLRIEAANEFKMSHKELRCRLETQLDKKIYCRWEGKPNGRGKPTAVCLSMEEMERAYRRRTEHALRYPARALTVKCRRKLLSGTLQGVR